MASNPAHSTASAASSSSGLSVATIIFVLFKHKWKIALITLLSLAGAALFYFQSSPTYISEAKLMVIYVKNVEAIDKVETTASVSESRTGDVVIRSEIEVIQSWDLAKLVTDKLGAEQILKKCDAGANPVAVISEGLTADAGKGSNVIRIAFEHPDMEMAQQILEHLVDGYFVQHKDIHRSAQSLSAIRNNHDKSSKELARFESTLRERKTNSSLPIAELMVNLETEAAKAEADFESAKVALAEQIASVGEVKKYVSIPGGPPESSAGSSNSASGQDGSDSKSETANASPPDQAVIAKYQAMTAKRSVLQTSLNSMLSKFAPGSLSVRSLEAQISGIESQCREMEAKNPYLLATAAKASSAPAHGMDLIAEQAKVAALLAKVGLLEPQVVDLRKRVTDLAALAPEISKLERERETEQKNFDSLSASLVKAEANLMIPSTQMPGIAPVQKPTPALRNTKMRDQIALAIAGGGPVLGAVVVLVFGLLLNRTIKRPLELEESTGLPLMMTIPYFSRRQRLQAIVPMGMTKATKRLKDSEPRKAPWEQYHFIRPFADAVRDRLSAYFDARGLIRKPKLIAVTGFNVGAGTSTLAAGLAASMSEMGEGKVLLVDMNGTHGEAHPFFDGNPVVSLTKALRLPAPGHSCEPGTDAHEGLFVARADAPSTGVSSAGLRRILPELKASDFDYVIFDMPPLGQTRPTATLAGLMDKVIVIVEAEATSRSEVQRGYRDLTESGADISMIFNKTRLHGPRALVGGV